MNLKGPPHDRGEDKTHWAPIEREPASPLPPLVVDVESGTIKRQAKAKIPSTKIVVEDFSGSIADPKWRNMPQNIGQAEAAIVGLQCPLCYSPMLLPIIRPPVNVWKVHCNHCATEIPIVVLLNRVAWMV